MANNLTIEGLIQELKESFPMDAPVISFKIRAKLPFSVREIKNNQPAASADKPTA